VHFVASTNDAAGAVRALADLQIDRGRLLAAERPTPSGVLRWQISVRDDGRRLFDGALPTVIEWGEAHPCDTLPTSGVELKSLRISHPEAGRLQRAFDAIGLRGVRAEAGSANIAAEVQSSKGVVRLESKGA
jgi:hypothetical protein